MTLFQSVIGSSILPSRTLNELKGFECECKRTAQSADQGFFGGIARDFGAQARTVFLERRRFEIPCDTFIYLLRKNAKRIFVVEIFLIYLFCCNQLLAKLAEMAIPAILTLR